MEFLPQDYEMMSWFTSTNKRSFFTYSVLCTKMLQDEEKEQIVGDISLYMNVIRRTVRGERTVVRECKTEKERADALAELFDVHLTEEEEKSIQGDVKIQ